MQRYSFACSPPGAGNVVIVTTEDGEFVLYFDAQTEEKDKEIARLKRLLKEIKLWCEVSVCEICGMKKMTNTDCYDYVKKALREVL